MSPFLLAASVILSLTNDQVVVDFNARGEVASLRMRAEGTELLASRTPFVMLQTDKGLWSANRAELRDGRIAFSFTADPQAAVTVSWTPFAGGWTFALEDVVAPSAREIRCGRLYPACCSIVGNRVNMVTDGTNAVCVRAYDLTSGMTCGRNWVQVAVPVSDAVGARFGLSAGRHGAMRDMLKGMTLASGRPHSAAGGAWATDPDSPARMSYLNANGVSLSNIDEWIDLMERGGFGVLHFREDWYARRGHYPVNTNNWPNGLADMKAAVGKIHAAGYLAGMHTLTGCIDPADPWVAGEENRELRARASYVLAVDLTEDAAELTVTEGPKVTTDTSFLSSGNGNAIRIGSEIVQFSGYTKTAPFKYTGLVRGAFGTRRAAHAKGDAADYLEQRYLAFYPDADKPLSDKVADAIANVFLTCGFDQIYCDGAESGQGVRSGLYTAKMRNKIIGRCAADGRSVLNEDSCGGGPHAWWFHSRIGAWDTCFWAPKRFHDYHVEWVENAHVKDGDLLEVQMGWWTPVGAQYYWPSQKLDDIEYYASRNAGLDATMSIQGVNVSAHPLSYRHSRMMTVLGWYERARLAHAFLPHVKEAMNVRGNEFRLRQNGVTGVWEIAPVVCRTARAALSARPAKTALRVEACHAGRLPSACTPLNMTASHRAGDLRIETAGTNVTLSVAETADEAGRRAFRLTASNATSAARGAWVSATAHYDAYRALKGNEVLRFRVKGDGSGAVLNVQIRSPREYGSPRNEHYVTLDFTGWREFELPMRETDTERFPDYVWPYPNYSSVFHTNIKFDKISDVALFLNEIPAGGRTVAEVSDVEMVPEIRTVAVRPQVIVNGEAHPIPFDLESGDFAEYEDGFWTLYRASCEPVERRAAERPISLVAGENTATYAGRTAEGRPCRAEVKLFAIGTPRPAIVDPKALPPERRRHFAYEAVEPDWFAPAHGFADLKPVVVRPGEKARVEFRICGPIAGGVLSFGGMDRPIADQGADAVRKIRIEGEFSGVTPVVLTARDAACHVEAVKRYVD